MSLSPGTRMDTARHLPRQRRPNRWWFRPLFVLLFVAPLVVIAEAGLRIFWHPDWPFHALCSAPIATEAEPGQWEPLPFLSEVFPAPGRNGDGTSVSSTTRGVLLRTNSVGCHGPELEHRPGELRVLMAGDSLVFGHLVPEEEAFAFRAGQLLEAAIDRPVTVLNSGGLQEVVWVKTARPAPSASGLKGSRGQPLRPSAVGVGPRPASRARGARPTPTATGLRG